MAFCRLVLSFLVFCTVSAFAKVQIPVFLWGDLSTSIKSNPLASVPENDFEAILKKELKEDIFTVIFTDETLSVEDFSHKSSDGDTSFPYLHSNIGNAVYLPAVNDPLDVLNRLADPEKVDHVKLTENGLSAEFEPESVKILFITLKDAREGETRGDMLRRHNDFMEEMFSKLIEEYKHVVAIYTARNPSWTVSETHNRVRRQVESNSSVNELNGLKFYANRIVLTVGETRTNLTDIQGSSSEIFSTNMSTTLEYGDNALTLFFTQKMGYWFFSSITLKESTSGETTSLYPDSEVYALIGFSYRCGQNVTFTSTNSSLTRNLLFQNLKVQPFFRNSLNETLVYGESVNCVGFFTVPIWSGLFVVFILLSITFYGIMMMMDIRTMDRFDDPKGKTITINAAE